MSDNTLNLPPLNVDLLADVVTWAAADAARIDKAKFMGWGNWNQELWAEQARNGVCQTSYCIAGQAVTQVGYALNLEFYDEVNGVTINRASECYQTVFAGLDKKGKPKFEPFGEPQYISKAARQALGLTDVEGDSLFDADNSIERIVWFATIFAKARGVTLDLPDEVMALREDRDDDEIGYYLGEDYTLLFAKTCETCGQTLPE